MKKLYFIYILIFLQAGFLKAQSNFRAGIVLNSGYSINNVIKDDFHFLQPEIENSISIETGGFVHYRITNSLGLNLKMCFGYVKYRLTYNDMEQYDKSWLTVDVPIALDTYQLIEDIQMPYLNIPLNIQFYVLRHFYVVGGAGINLKLLNSIRPRGNLYFLFGMGGKSKKINWELFLENPYQTKMYKISDPYINSINESPSVNWLDKTLKLSLSYNLWSIQ